jgi:hypothetical protein
MTCKECDTRNADVLPSRGDCQTCLKARLAAVVSRTPLWSGESRRYVRGLDGEMHFGPDDNARYRK